MATFPLVALLHLYESGLFEHGQMLTEVAGGQVESAAQKAELHASSLMSDRQDTQPDFLVNDVIDCVAPAPLWLHVFQDLQYVPFCLALQC
ncbi:hypothetical protein ACH4S8_04310 [Streptomyces sp. NPDC021080]|uniref:hypothetical protein n=1 Tax=Streptomyces sp. NPDC021080 TaxID=3365110 RepID=UPI0037935D10